MGPPITHAAISPTVLLAMPSSIALAIPRSPTKIGAQATVVPTPPVSETDPTIRPAFGSSPNNAAIPIPVTFWMSMNAVASASSTMSGLPPCKRVAVSDFRPMLAKNSSSRWSRTPSSNWILQPAIQ